jgi:hypothetical protein
MLSGGDDEAGPAAKKAKRDKWTAEFMEEHKEELEAMRVSTTTEAGASRALATHIKSISRGVSAWASHRNKELTKTPRRIDDLRAFNMQGAFIAVPEQGVEDKACYHSSTVLLDEILFFRLKMDEDLYLDHMTHGLHLAQRRIAQRQGKCILRQKHSLAVS